LNPASKESLLNHFYPLFHKFKLEKKPLSISISLVTNKPNTTHNFFSSSTNLNISAMPDLSEEDCGDGSVDLFTNFKLYYSIKQDYEASTLSGIYPT
jgi:hypothetical protein